MYTHYRHDFETEIFKMQPFGFRRPFDITEIEIVDNKLVLRFEDGTVLTVFDDDRQCCEKRWMHTDDDLTAFVGTKLYGLSIRKISEETYGSKNWPGEGDWNDEGDRIREIAFLVVNTSKGQFTVANYNQNNGYYCGFNIKVDAKYPKKNDG